MAGKKNTHDIIIIGSGPAGWTAALYASRANLDVVVFEGPEPGGQLMTTTDVENYPGFEEGIPGPELMEKLKKQAVRFGTTVISENVAKVDFTTEPHRVVAGKKEYSARAVIISTGASAKWLGLESETAYHGKGISSCATCDGFFFKDKDIIVIGGGDTAIEEALFLARFGKSVTVVHRRESLRASKIMQERAMKHDKIKFLWNKSVIEFVGDGKALTGAKLEDTKTGKRSQIRCQGAFIAIGHQPNTGFLDGQIDVDEGGYILVKQGTVKTGIPGVFAAGDVVDKRYRQAVIAAGMGCMAAMDAEKWLEERA